MNHDTTPPSPRRDLGRFQPAADGGQPFDAATRTPRLLLRARGDESGGVDGAWWPRTSNLTSELHDVINALTERLGATRRLSFDWNAHSISQRNIDRPDGVQVTGPLPEQPPDIMYVFGTDGRRLQLLIIPPDTAADDAFAAMQRSVGSTAD